MTTSKWVYGFGKRPIKQSVCVFFTALLICFSLLAQAQDAASAKEFLQNIYNGYQGTTELPNNEYTFFDSKLLSLIDQDEALARTVDEVPYIDGDVFCNCQENQGLIVKKITVIPVKNGKTDATVAYIFGKENRTSKFDLVTFNSQWRIHDVHDAETPSLYKALQKDISERMKSEQSAPNNYAIALKRKK